ncbi:MAG: CBS domain-containing protein [Thaumarchaeota archaeon]|nr:CBS domain-containing protein [Nitrososphaerota archaeon]
MSKVKDIMTKNVVTVEPEDRALNAAVKMREKGIGALMVVSKGSPVGILTERDLVRKVIAAKKDPKSTRVADIMSKPLVTTTPNTSVREAAKKMMINDVRRLPVVANGKLVGIITAADLAKNLAGELTGHDAILYAVARYHKYGY